MKGLKVSVPREPGGKHSRQVIYSGLGRGWGEWPGRFEIWQNGKLYFMTLEKLEAGRCPTPRVAAA